MKNWIYLLSCLFLWSCSTDVKESDTASTYYQIMGEAQGTTYSIIFNSDLDPNKIKTSIDSLLQTYDLQNSIYKSGSLISQLNESKDSLFLLSDFPESDHFETCFYVSKELYNQTNGAFNPAVYPLVNYWGFHKEDFNYTPDSNEIKGLLDLIDFSDINFKIEQNHFFKSNPASKIDFNALAQGHSVDVVGDYLQQIGIKNYMVEIGGEITCKGKNQDNMPWRVGIEKPIDAVNDSKENDLQIIVALMDKSLATSGNYRKYYEMDGQKYAHTIDPVTGYPARQSLLSVTVITQDCIYADAYATAFMVMGLEKSVGFIEKHPELEIEAYFVYDETGQFETKMTKGFETFILE